jgi:hypothetical protein
MKKGTFALGLIAVFASIFTSCESMSVKDVVKSAVTDTAPPTVASAVVENAHLDRIVITFSENVIIPTNEGWTITTDGGALTIGAVPFKLMPSNTVILPLSRNVKYDENIKLSYNASTALEKIRDLSLKELAAFADKPVDKDTAPPNLLSAEIKQDAKDKLVLTFDENVTVPAASGVTLSAGSALTVKGAPDVSGTTVTFTLNRAIGANDEDIKLGITNTAIADIIGNPFAGVADRTVDKADITPPSLISAVIENTAQDKLILTFSEDVNAGGNADKSGLSVTTDSKTALSFRVEPIDGSGGKVLAITLNRFAVLSEKITLKFAKENTIADKAGNKLVEGSKPVIINIEPVGTVTDNTGKTTQVDSIADAFNWIKDGKAEEYTVDLIRDVRVDSAQTLTSPNAKKITLQGGKNLCTITRGDFGSGVFVIDGKVTLVLGNNIKLTGEGVQDWTLVQIKTGGTFQMEKGSTVFNYQRRDSGGTIFVNGGTFVMNGGDIINNTTVSSGDTPTSNASDGLGAGAVQITNNGTFTMAGGNISGNSGFSGGGVFLNNGTFTMAGGTISNNTVKASPAGKNKANSGFGGGVFALVGTFKKTGGAISGNAVKDAGDADVASGNGKSAYVSTGKKKRDADADAKINLDSADATGWDK